MENALEIVDCESQRCVIRPACKLKHALGLATQSFINTLREFTLADLVESKEASLIQLLKL
jgi:Rrf2 family nitric oxide-sensitive transcriptional repressor